MSRLPIDPGIDRPGLSELKDTADTGRWLERFVGQFGELYRRIRHAIEGPVFPRRLDQADIPTSGPAATQIVVGELLVWRDSDNGKVYVVYNDADSGVLSVELT